MKKLSPNVNREQLFVHNKYTVLTFGGVIAHRSPSNFFMTGGGKPANKFLFDILVKYLKNNPLHNISRNTSINEL